MAPSFFNSYTCSRNMLGKNWRLCKQLAARACKICFCGTMSSIVQYQCIIQNKYPRAVSWKFGSMQRGCELAMVKKYNYGVKTAFFTPLVCLSLVLEPSGRQSHANCTVWLPVTCKFPPFLFMLHVTGGQRGTICMQLAATRVQIIYDWSPVAWKFLHAQAASCLQSCQFCASTLRE